MKDIPVEQALYRGPDAGGFELLGRSTGFRDEWRAEAERLCAGFGRRPPGVACPACVFARPLGPRHVAVVQVADQPEALGFRLLVLPRAAYVNLLGDPFVVADRFPPDWEARGELPALTWPAEPSPRRTVQEVQKVL